MEHLSKIAKSFITIAKYAEAQMLKDKTRVTYAKSFYNGLAGDIGMTKKIENELLAASKGKTRVLKNMINQNDGQVIVVIEEYQLPD